MRSSPISRFPPPVLLLRIKDDISSRPGSGQTLLLQRLSLSTPFSPHLSFQAFFLLPDSSWRRTWFFFVLSRFLRTVCWPPAPAPVPPSGTSQHGAFSASVHPPRPPAPHRFFFLGAGRDRPFAQTAPTPDKIHRQSGPRCPPILPVRLPCVSCRRGPFILLAHRPLRKLSHSTRQVRCAAHLPEVGISVPMTCAPKVGFRQVGPG